MDRFGNRFEVLSSPPCRKWTVRQQFGEALSLHVIHREILLSLNDAHLVNRHNVWVLQARRRRGLRSKAFHKLITRPWTKRQHFERNDTIQADIPCAIYDAHTTSRHF